MSHLPASGSGDVVRLPLDGQERASLRKLAGEVHFGYGVLIESALWNLANAETEIERLRDALTAAQGEAYLGTLVGDSDPLAACQNVISVCLDALNRTTKEAENGA